MYSFINSEIGYAPRSGLTILMPRRQAAAHNHKYKGEMSVKPSKVVYMNDGQTKITLIGNWFFMSGEEISKDYEDRLKSGDPVARGINNTLLCILEKD